jgi:hypothetical protein
VLFVLKQLETMMNSKAFFRQWVQPKPELTLYDCVLVVGAMSTTVVGIFTLASVANVHGGHYTLASVWWGEVVINATNWLFGK